MPNTDYPFFDEEEIPGSYHPGRAPLPRPWVKKIKAKPRKWALIEEFDDPKKATGRGNSHRVWAKTQGLPIQVMTKTLPGNWQEADFKADPAPPRGYIFARWIKSPRKKS